MAEDEGDRRRHELKTAKRDYTGYDDDEFGPGAVAGMKRNVLAKYDEDISGPSETVSHCLYPPDFSLTSVHSIRVSGLEAQFQ